MITISFLVMVSPMLAKRGITCLKKPGRLAASPVQPQRPFEGFMFCVK